MSGMSKRAGLRRSARQLITMLNSLDVDVAFIDVAKRRHTRGPHARGGLRRDPILHA